MQAHGELPALCESRPPFGDSTDPHHVQFSWTSEGTASRIASHTEDKPFKIRKMYWSALAALLMATAMGLAVGYSGPAIFDMTTRPDSVVKPTEEEQSWIGSILTMGIMLGSMYAGPLADRFGRKGALVFNVIPFAAGWLTIGCARSVTTVIAGRFICGMALGVVNVVVPVYCVEISTAEVRGLLGSSFMGFLNIGNLVSAVMGSFLSWEYLALSAAVFTTFAFLCCLPIPESPRWLVSKGRMRQAVTVVDYIQAGFVNAEEECRTIQADIESAPRGRLSLKEWLHPTVYKPVLIASLVTIFQQFSGVCGILFYASSLFDTVKSFLSPKQSTMVLSSVLMIATLLGNLVVDRAGRKVLLLLSAASMAVTISGLGAFYYVSATNSYIQTTYSWVPLMALNLYVIGFATGFGTIPCMTAAELVPLRARGAAVGISIFASALSSFIVTKTFEESNEWMGIYGTFWTYGGFCLLGFFFVAFVVPETKGKKLEDIAKIFDYPENCEKIVLIN